MLIAEAFLLIALFESTSSANVNCNSSCKKYRNSYRGVLSDGGVVFALVSYAFLGQQNNSEPSFIKETIEKSLAELFIPIAINLFNPVDEKETNELRVWGCGALATEGHLKYLKKQGNQIYLPTGEELPTTYFISNYGMNREEKFVFLACRIQLLAQRKLNVIKFIVVVSRDEEENLLQEDFNNIEMQNFMYSEFEDRGLDICNHMEYYLNECALVNRTTCDSFVFLIAYFVAEILVIEFYVFLLDN